MSFILSKTVAFFVLPSNLLIILCVVGAVLIATRFKRAGSRLAAVSLLLLAVAGFLPVGSLLIHTLESRFPRWDASRGAPDGIVVLGGVIATTLSQDYGEPVVGGDAGRVFAIAKLARAFPNARIVYTGGDASLLANGQPETKFLHPLLDNLGIARERVLLEPRSRNTAENALFSKELVNPKAGERWLLVTSAVHMPRAVGCFRRIGFAVDAYPVNWRTRKSINLTPNWDFARGLSRLDAAAYEWVGLLSYWLTGQTSELFPGPLGGQ